MVEPKENITRYLFSKKSFRADGTLKHNEFMPPSSKKLSVFRTDNKSQEEIWDLGRQYVEPHRGKPMEGRADVSAQSIFEVELEITPTDLPHPLHADVVGWKGDTEDRLIAMKLAEKAKGTKAV